MKPEPITDATELTILEPEQEQDRSLPVDVAAPDNSPASMMLAALGRGASLADLKQMMDLQQQWEANEARKAYHKAFADFKAEAVKIIRNRGVDAGPLQGKRYAELHSVVDAVTPALSRHGLSASWKLTKDDKEWLEVTCTLSHAQGHSECVAMGGPPDAGGAKNAIQARASTVSYLERYTLKAICGVAEAGQDDDGNGGDQTNPDELVAQGREEAMKGMQALTAWWGTLDAKQRGKLNKEFGQMRKAAQEADRAK